MDKYTKNSEREEIRLYELAEIQEHSTNDDCWIIFGKNVYDVTNFLDKHPGGSDLIMREAGKDITRVLKDENIHRHSANAYTILKDYKIGEIAKQDVVLLDNEEYEIIEEELTGFKEDLVDWDRGMVMQVYKFGHDYNKWVHTPVMKKMKMFDNPLIEFCSNTRWYIIPALWIPVMCLFGVSGYTTLSQKLDGHTLLISFIITFLGGVLLWTYIEYALHRYVFHLEPNGDSPLQITLHFTIHGNHHKVPFDEGRLVFPPTLSIIMSFPLWHLLAVLLPDGYDALVFAGGVGGYVCYDLIHYYIHHGNPSKHSYLDGMKHYHVRHHFVDQHEGYGISTKLWDRVFEAKRKFL